ncbi:unnamed protein product [Mucor hiemalis]
MDMDLVNVVSEYDTAAEDFNKVMKEFQSAINKMISFYAFADKESDTNQIHRVSPDDNTTYDKSVVSSESALESTQQMIVEDETPVETQQYTISVTVNKSDTENTFKKCAQERTMEEVEKDEATITIQQHQESVATNKSNTESVSEKCAQEIIVEEIDKDETLVANQQLQITPTTNKRPAGSEARVLRKRRMTTPITVASPSRTVQKTNAKKTATVASPSKEVQKTNAKNMVKVNPIDKLTGLPIPLFEELPKFNNANQGDYVFYRRLLYEAQKVDFFIDTFEQHMKNSGDESNWYSLLESCFEKDPERLNFPWFKRSIPERCSWSTAKSILMATFGHRNSKVQIAVEFILGKTQQENHRFQYYFNTYGLAVKGVPHLGTFSLVHPKKRKSDYLINNFIERTLCKEVSEALNATLVGLNAAKTSGETVTWK